MKKSKFDFNEIVKISTNNKKKKIYNGKLGYVDAVTNYEYDDGTNKAGDFAYGVTLFNIDYVHMFDEHELESTGEFVPEGYGMSDTTITVNQDGEVTGVKKTDD